MRIPLLFALTWMVVKIIIFYTSIVTDTLQAGIFLNLLFIAILVYSGVRKGAATSMELFHLLKAGMRPAATYVLLVSIGIFCYYKFLDADFFESRLEEVVIQTQKGIESAGGWEAFRKSENVDPSMDKESFLEEQRTSLGRILFSALPQASYSLLALTMTAFFYSFITSFIFKGMQRYLK
ncbi:MAG: DUF4199 family protein [Bacteroidetes bacterium]|jgi:hypothetical protein|nr:DUF4199 family protein [Bacteroidota bacterium]MDA0973104.1 DUF4199 family protein [Bacteroidota bacterium]